MEREKVLDRVSDELAYEMKAVDQEKLKEAIIPFLSMVYGAGFNKAWYIAHSRNEKKVLQKTITGHAIRVWENIGEAEACTGIDKSNISKCCRGIRKTTGGFTWEYTNL